MPQCEGRQTGGPGWLQASPGQRTPTVSGRAAPSTRYDSPLRYPGGKAALAPLLARIITLNGLSGCSYFEPFAGGAGAALRLLRERVVEELHLNDLDPRIHAFWYAALNEPERFADTIRSVPLDLDEWNRQKRICQRPEASKTFELGFAAFYLNRCNRSGVLSGAAPIGGHGQKGKWAMDARFNRENLIRRVFSLARQRERIHVTNLDARGFLVSRLPRGDKRKGVFGYLDPPYHSNGRRLYMNFYADRDHRRLASYVLRQRVFKWVISYDDTSFIRKLYRDCAVHYLPVRYCLQHKRRAGELLVASSGVRLPDSILPGSSNRENGGAVAERRGG